MTTAAKRRDGAVSIYPVLAVNFIGTLGYSIILPFLVFLVTRLQGNALVYGLLGATYPAFQLIGAPVLGRWSDVYGRKRILLLSQAGTLLSWLIFSVALFLPHTPLIEASTGFVVTLPVAVLFLARALDGLTGGNVSVANAYLADISTEKERSVNFGKMAISANLGFVVGPALAGLLGATHLRELLPVLAAALISAAGTVLVGFLREPDPCEAQPGPRQLTLRRILGYEHRDCIEAKDPVSVGWRQVLATPHVAFMLLLYFLIFLGFNFFYTAFPVHAARTLEWSIPQTGTFFMVLSALMVFVQGPVLRRVSLHAREEALIVAGNLVLAGAFVLFAREDVRSISCGVVLFALGNGVMWPSVLALLARLAGKETQGAVQGLAGGVGSLASILGLVLGGLLYGVLGTGTFLVSAGTILFVSLLSVRLLRLRAAPDGEGDHP